MTPLQWVWLGTVPYGEALARQRARRRAIQDRSARETIWLLEHPPVVTTGRRPAPGTPDAQALAAEGVELHATERGGLATYHAPGQLVAYLLVDIGRRGIAVRALVERLEDAVIDWLASRNIIAGRRSGLPGVWVGDDKVAALGLHIQHGVSMHGLALNLSVDLSGFRLIVPCGIRDAGVTSVETITGRTESPTEVAAELGPILVAVIENRRPPCSEAGSLQKTIRIP